MGVTIEQYRARVGSHINFLKQKEITGRLNSTLWNTMLILFYVNVFYLPTLHQLNQQYRY